jgi:hypothetical protein
VFTSPRPPGRAIGRRKRFDRITHEMLSYSMWRLGL